MVVRRTAKEVAVVEVGPAPTTTKELRQRVVAEWDNQCKVATENGWCEDGKTQLREIGFIPEATFNVTVKYDVQSTRSAEDVKRDVERILTRGYLAYGTVVSSEATVEAVDTDVAPIDKVELDAAIAKVTEKARYWIRNYDRGGLETAIRNTLNAAGIPLPEKKARKYTLTLEGVTDATPEEVAQALKGNLSYAKYADTKVEAQEVTA
jgi:hypothetical protein